LQAINAIFDGNYFRTTEPISVKGKYEAVITFTKLIEKKEEPVKTESTGISAIKQAINAYYAITASSEFREIERLRSLARHNEAAALRHARDEEREKWQTVVADKDAEIARLREQLEGKGASA